MELGTHLEVEAGSNLGSGTDLTLELRCEERELEFREVQACLDTVVLVVLVAGGHVHFGDGLETSVELGGKGLGTLEYIPVLEGQGCSCTQVAGRVRSFNFERE